MAHKFAQELNVTPWEGLLLAVRVAAGKLAYCETVIASASNDRELEGRVNPNAVASVAPDGEITGERDLSWWVGRGEYWHTQLARCSKMAVDAGVAKVMLEQIEMNAQAVASVLLGTVTDLGLDEATEARARAALRRRLLELDAQGTAVMHTAIGGSTTTDV